MKQILLGISLIWAAPLISMNNQHSYAKTIAKIRVHDNNGKIFIIDPSDVDTSQIEVGTKICVGFDDPQTNNHEHIVGTITDIQYRE